MKTKFWLIIFGVVLVVCAVASFFLFRPKEQVTYAEIYSDNQLVKTVDLRESQTFTIESELGSNVITITTGKLSVLTASCPDKLCVHQGFCKNGADIVCLPNRLVIRFVDKAGIDGAVG